LERYFLDSSTNVSDDTADRQVSSLYVYNEHHHHSHNGDHHQLELSHTENAPNESLGPNSIPQLSASVGVFKTPESRQALSEEGV